MNAKLLLWKNIGTDEMGVVQVSHFKMEFLLKAAEKQRQMYWGIEHVLRIVPWSLKVQVDIILPKLRGQNYLNNL